MSRLVFDGNYHVYWLDAAPASKTAPTTAEIAAGTDLTAFIPKNGFNPAVKNNRVTGGDLSTTFTDESMGTYTSQLVVTAYLDDGNSADTAWDTFTKGATGCLIVTPYAAAATGVKAYVWPDVEAGQRTLMQTAENTRQTFQAEFAVRAEPTFDAAVA